MSTEERIGILLFALAFALAALLAGILIGCTLGAWAARKTARKWAAEEIERRTESLTTGDAGCRHKRVIGLDPAGLVPTEEIIPDWRTDRRRR